MHTVLPLFHPDLSVAPRRYVRLANGYELAAPAAVINAFELFDNDKHCKRKFGEETLSRGRSANLYIRVRENVPPGTNPKMIVDKSNTKLDRLLLAFNVNERLWNFPHGDMRFSWFKDGKYRRVSQRLVWPRLSYECHPTFKEFSEAAKMSRIIDRIYSGEPYRVVRTALDALQFGSYDLNIPIRFLQEAIALEALCSGNNAEITHRIAVACAILTERNPEQRKQTYFNAKRLYGIRSRIIHGSGGRVTLDQLKEIEALTRKILRRVINKLLLNFETTEKQKEFLLGLSLEKRFAL